MPARSMATAPRTSLMVTLLLALAWTGFAPVEARADDERYVRVKVDTANLRRDPSREADPVRYAFENEPLQVVARQGPWLQVRDFEGDSAWIYGPLTDERPAVVVTRPLINVRQRPGTHHPVVFQAERAVNLRVLERTGRWLHVEHELGQGWVHDSLVWGGP